MIFTDGKAVDTILISHESTEPIPMIERNILL